MSGTETVDERKTRALAAVKELVAMATGEDRCKRCKGTGDYYGYDCPDCDGEGWVE